MPPMRSQIPFDTLNDIREFLSALLEGHVVRSRGEGQSAALLMGLRHPAVFPLRESSSFRPSEIMQGLFLGALKDISNGNRSRLLLGHGISVFVCCCSVSKKSSDADSVDVAMYRPCLAEVRVLSTHGNATGSDLICVRSERYQGEWWRWCSEEQSRLFQWLDLHFLSESPLNERKELTIRIPAIDSIDYSFSAADAPYMSVIPCLLDFLLRASGASPDGRGVPEEGGPAGTLECVRRFGIAVYCVAGRSRSVTMVAATLLYQLIRVFADDGEDSLRVPQDAVPDSSADGIKKGVRTLRDFCRRGHGDEVARVAVGIVLSYIRGKRMIAYPNPGFYEQLVDFASEMLGTAFGLPAGARVVAQSTSL